MKFSIPFLGLHDFLRLAALHHTSIAQDHQLVKVTETLGIRLKNHNLIKLAHVRRFTPQEHHEAFVSSNYLS